MVFTKYVEQIPIRTPWKETRLLLYYLSNVNDNEKLQSYLDQYIKDDYDMNEIQNCLCIKLVPEEKELKEASRLFGCKTY